MSRSFNPATPDFLRSSSAVATAAPFTVAGWFRSPGTGVTTTLWWMGNKSSNLETWLLYAHNSAAVRFRSVSTSTASIAIDTTNTYTANTWHHACAVEASATDHRVFLDGAGKATSSTSTVPAGVDRTTLGYADDSSPSTGYDGMLGHWTMWDVALTDDEVATLAAGVSPFTVRPGNIVAYWPANGRSPEPDIVGAFDLTLGGSPSISDEPPIHHPIWAA